MALAPGPYLVLLRAASTAEGRRHLDAGAWLVSTLLAVLALSYYGELGPMAAPALPEPYDLIAIVVLTLASYWWSVNSGFHTEQLDEALAENSIAPAAERTPRSGEVPIGVKVVDARANPRTGQRLSGRADWARAVLTQVRARVR